MNCPNCDGRATVTNGQCAACGAVVRAGTSHDALTSFGDVEAPTGAGLPPPPFPGTGSGFDDATGSGTSEEAPTSIGGPAARSKHARDGSTGPLVPGEPFGDRYHIVRLLGIGGMGAVYQAWDAELGVVVALKVTRPGVADDPAATAHMERRFKQELLLARQVTHRNVVRIHDIGEINGTKFITMPFIEGEELAAIIRRKEKIPIPRVLRIARGIASGLEAAHAAGVVHRDLKPANIMVDKSDEPMIMDFGIARSTGGPDPKSPGASTVQRSAFTSAQTMAGAIVGTVAYMAPEQARAEPVDQRADIYAFGLILYDMLLHEPRARGADSALAELTDRMQAAPPSPRSVDPAIPEPVDQLVTTCIQSDAARRFQTTADLVSALNRIDDTGYLIPAVRRVTWRLVAGVLGVFATLLGLTWWFAQGPAPAVAHEPVSVLIADIRNGSGDATFDHSLEPILKLALEGAGFINAFDRAGIRRSLGVRPPEQLDERAATELAVKQGVGVVLAGSVEHQDTSYVVSLKATHAVTGHVITSATETAASKDQVLGVTTRLATRVREGLGDDSSDSAQRFAMETLSATSLDVVREYAAAMDALSRSKFEEALQSFRKSVALDPNFGLAYAGMAIASRNLDRQQDAEKYVKQAIGHLDGMTERERYRTRGLFYYVTSDYQSCVKEYGDLIGRFASDAAARNNLALCLTYLREMPRAMEEMRQVVKILPNRALYRVNLALYANYSGDFDTGEQEARTALEQSPWSWQALALSQTGQGQVAQATQSYEHLGSVEEVGPSYSASGLGDLATYQGRFADAVRILGQGAADDLKAGNADRAANKFAALAFAHLLQQQHGPAAEAAEQALVHSQAVKIRFLAARIFAEAGATARARALGTGLAAELQAEPQAYAKIVDGVIAMKNRDARQAIKTLTEANALMNTWIGHFDLGRAYLDAGAFTQADSEFDRCLKRRGEALALFLDEEPTYGYFPATYYYQGRVREGLHSARFAESYQAYLDIRGNAGEDPLLPDIRRRAAH